MKNCIHQNGILVLLVTNVCVTQAIFVQNFYSKMEPRQSIRGETKAQFTATSAQECCLRCSSDSDCDACRYQPTELENCLLIILVHDADTFMAAERIHIYKRESKSLESNDSNMEQITEGPGDPLEVTTSPLVLHQWTPPAAWTGPLPVIYRSFDTLDDLTLMKGNNEENFNALVSGKVNSAIRTNKVNRQWVDLGDMSTSCMMIGTCMAPGGAVNLWMRVNDCPTHRTGGIISAYTESKGYFRIRCGNCNIWYDLFLRNKIFSYHETDAPAGWSHVVVNYIGPGSEGLYVYYNGNMEGDGRVLVSGPLQAGNGRVVVGRHLPEEDEHYAGVKVDELLVFNSNLDGDQITAIYNQQN